MPRSRRAIHLATLVLAVSLGGAATASAAVVGTLSKAGSQATLTSVAGTSVNYQVQELNPNFVGVVVYLPDTIAAGSGCSANPIQAGDFFQQTVCTGVTSFTADVGDGADSFSVSAETTGFPTSVTSTGSSLSFSGGAENDTVSVAAGTALTASGGAGNDVLTGGSGTGSLDGGPGADTLTGGSGGETLSGGTENDTLTGNGGNDTLNGGAGDDVLNDSGATSTVGNDTYNGDAGLDRVSYTTVGDGVTASIDGVANDGSAASGATDNVRATVEAISGSGFDDTLTGSTTAAEALAGYGGNDTLNGLDGNDFMAGGSPTDTTTQTDTYNGGSGADTATFSYLGTNGVNVSIDGAANDGTSPVLLAASGTSNVKTDVERVNGSNQADRLTTTIGATLQGFGGIDSLIGSAASDFLDGGPETTNTLDCAGGTDGYRAASTSAGLVTNCENPQ